MSLLSRLFKRHRKQSGKKSFGLNELDLKLKPYLPFKRGFFLEAGANDGVSQSNTLYLETYLGWHGLLIEPVPELADRCRRNRPGSNVANCALVASDFVADEVEMLYCNLMSLTRGARKSEEADREHVERGCKLQGISTYSLKVPARTLASVLDEHKVPAIDLFSLDVEGYELEVLRGMDLGRYRPKLLLVEATFRDEVEAYLKPIYEPIADLSHQDVLYRCNITL